jgi:hypothetical protein
VPSKLVDFSCPFYLNPYTRVIHLAIPGRLNQQIFPVIALNLLNCSPGFYPKIGNCRNRHRFDFMLLGPVSQLLFTPPLVSLFRPTTAAPMITRPHDYGKIRVQRHDRRSRYRHQKFELYSDELLGHIGAHQRKICLEPLRTAEISAAGQTTCQPHPSWPGEPQHQTRPTGRLSRRCMLS